MSIAGSETASYTAGTDAALKPGAEAGRDGRGHAATDEIGVQKIAKRMTRARGFDLVRLWSASRGRAR